MPLQMILCMETNKRAATDYTIGETKVIYCVDTDLFEVNVDHNNELKNVKQYCDSNGYDMIWFCHDVEEVYLGKSISDKQKVDEAKKFRTKNKILEVSQDKLSSNNMRKCVSNILIVLDKYLSRKH